MLKYCRSNYFGQGFDANPYSILPNNFTFLRHEEPSLSVAAVAVAAAGQQNSYDNLMNTYQNLVQQQQPMAVSATTLTLPSSSISLTSLNGGIGARECTACGQIYDYELEKDLRGCRYLIFF